MDDLQRDELVVLVLNGTAEIQAGISATQREANSLQLKKFVPCFLRKIILRKFHMKTVVLITIVN